MPEQTIQLQDFEDTISSLPLANVEFDTTKQLTTVEVALQTDLCYDALLGTDFPEIWNLGRSLLYRETTNFALTRAQT